MAIFSGSSAKSVRSIMSEDFGLARTYHRAVRMPEGIAMIVGGQTQNPRTPSMEPTVFRVTGTALDAQARRTVSYEWETLGHALTIRSQNFGISQFDNSILLTGGHDGFQPEPDDAWDLLTYHEATAVNTLVSGTMPVKRAAHAQATFGGEALICGGFELWNTALDSAYLFDFDLQTWAAAPAMKYRRMEHQAVTCPDGIVVIGGRDPFQRPVADANDLHYWPLDTAPGNISPDLFGTLDLDITGDGTLTLAGKGGASLNVANTTPGAVTSAGAEQTALNDLFRDEEYTVEVWFAFGYGAIFSNIGTSGTPADDEPLFYAHKTGEVLTVGYEGGSFTTTRLLTEVVPFGEGADSTPPFHHMAIVVTKPTPITRGVAIYIDGELFEEGVIGTPPPAGGTANLFHVGGSAPTVGADEWSKQLDEIRISSGARTEAEILERYIENRGVLYRDVPNLNYWEPEYNNFPISKVLSTCEFWDGSGWTQVGSLTFARYGFGTVTLPDNRVLVCGGIGYNPSRGTEAVPLKSCEIFDPTSKTWAHLPDMAEAREFPSAVYVPALNAVVVGGGRGKTTCEILDLETMRWRTSLAQMEWERYRTQAVHLIDDLVLFAGGSRIDADGDFDESEAHSYLFVPAGETVWKGGLNSVVQVEAVPAADTFVYRTPEFAQRDLTRTGPFDEVAHKFQAQAAPENLPGPYMHDPKNGIAITGTEAPTATKLLAGHQYITLLLQTAIDDLTPAARFPDEEGWLVFSFGHENQVWPVRYMGRISDTELALDASFTFPTDLPAGTEVRLVAQRGAFIPNPAVPAGAFYATASSAGRVAASAAIDDTVAAGVPIRKRVTYPGDRGLGGEGLPATGSYKLTDAIRVWGGDDLNAEIKKAQEEE